MLESLHDMIFYWVDSVNITPYHLNWNVRKIYSNRGEYISRIIVLISVNWVQLPKIPPNKNCNLFASGLYILFQLFVQMIINILSFHEVSLGLDFNSNWRNNSSSEDFNDCDKHVLYWLHENVSLFTICSYRMKNGIFVLVTFHSFGVSKRRHIHVSQPEKNENWKSIDWNWC